MAETTNNQAQQTTDPVEGSQPAASATEEKVLTFKESELAKLLQAESDRVATKAIQTSKAKWEKDFAEKLEVEKAEAARLAKLSETERKEVELQKMREELEAERRMMKNAELERKALENLVDNKLNTKLQKYVMADNDDGIAENIKGIQEIIEEEVKSRIEQQFKSAGRQVDKGNPAPTGKTEFKRSDLLTPEGRTLYNATPGARIID